MGVEYANKMHNITANRVYTLAKGGYADTEDGCRILKERKYEVGDATWP